MDGDCIGLIDADVGDMYDALANGLIGRLFCWLVGEFNAVVIFELGILSGKVGDE